MLQGSVFVTDSEQIQRLWSTGVSEINDPTLEMYCTRSKDESCKDMCINAL